MGRWALKVFSDANTQFQLPVVIGIITILMLTLTAGLTVSILEISNKLTVILVSAFLVTFPSVACFFPICSQQIHILLAFFQRLGGLCGEEIPLGLVPSDYIVHIDLWMLSSVYLLCHWTFPDRLHFRCSFI